MHLIHLDPSWSMASKIKWLKCFLVRSQKPCQEKIGTKNGVWAFDPFDPPGHLDLLDGVHMCTFSRMLDAWLLGCLGHWTTQESTTSHPWCLHTGRSNVGELRMPCRHCDDCDLNLPRQRHQLIPLKQPWIFCSVFQGNNFKDAGVQTYGGDLFQNIRDKGWELGCIVKLWAK